MTATLLPPTMRAYVGTPAGPDLRQVASPLPEAGEALVRVEAFSVNRGELHLFARRAEGWRPGQDLSGRVLRAAADGSGPPTGSRVAAMVDFGGWAEYTAVPTDRLAELPDGVDLAPAATLGVAGLTALRALRRGGPLLGKRVLITGASGGVGTFAVQLAAAAGAEVTAWTGTHRSADLTALGAARVVDSLDAGTGADDDFDLVLDSVGGEVLLAALKRAAPHADIVLLGTTSRTPVPLSISTFRPHVRQTVHPFWVYGSGEPVDADLGVLLRLMAAGRLRPLVGWSGPWEQLPGAMQLLNDRRIPGKAVLGVPGGA
jgi:NADPH2:quinone reductase